MQPEILELKLKIAKLEGKIEVLEEQLSYERDKKRCSRGLNYYPWTWTATNGGTTIIDYNGPSSTTATWETTM